MRNSNYEPPRLLNTHEQLDDRQIRCLEKLEHYDLKIVPIPGTKKAVAKALSRNKNPAVFFFEANIELLARVLDTAIPRAEYEEERKNTNNKRRIPKQPKKISTTELAPARCTTWAQEPAVIEEADRQNSEGTKFDCIESAPSNFS